MVSTSNPPDVIHRISVPRPSWLFADFRCSSASMYYTKRKPKNKIGGGLGMSLQCYIPFVCYVFDIYVTRSVSWFIVNYTSVRVAQALPNKHHNIMKYCLKIYNL